MKPLFKQMVAVLTLGMTLPLTLSSVAYAEETPATGPSSAPVSKQGSATVTIKGSGLKFTSVPSFMESTDVATLKNHPSLPVSSKENLTVDDERGTHTGWTVTAKLTELTTTNPNHTITGASLNFSKTDTATNGLTIASTPLPDDSTPVALLATNKKHDGAGNTDVALNNTTMTLPANDIYAGTYSGQITYTLNDGPQA